MVNLEHKLTVDDLIVEYMIYKVKNGYKASFMISEFMHFLNYFESKMQVEDSLCDGVKLFQRFFERKGQHDWSRTINWNANEKEIIPHMEMIYSDKDEDYLIKANYKLSAFDISVINTYFMDNGMGKYDDYKGQTFKIRSIIAEYLANYPKRKIDDNVEIDDNDLVIAKYIAAEIINNIWDSYIKDQVEKGRWPKQCRDINKYLFEIDLAEIIGVESLKNDLLDLYSVISKRIAIMYHKDRELQISTYSNVYLARANYELIIQGYEKIMGIAFGNNKKSLDINLATLTFKESHELDGVYNWDEDPDIKTTLSTVGNEKVKTLINSLESEYSVN